MEEAAKKKAEEAERAAKKKAGQQAKKKQISSGTAATAVQQLILSIAHCVSLQEQASGVPAPDMRVRKYMEPDNDWQSPVYRAIVEQRRVGMESDWRTVQAGGWEKYMCDSPSLVPLYDLKYLQRHDKERLALLGEPKDRWNCGAGDGQGVVLKDIEWSLEFCYPRTSLDVPRALPSIVAGIYGTLDLGDVYDRLMLPHGALAEETRYSLRLLEQAIRQNPDVVHGRSMADRCSLRIPMWCMADQLQIDSPAYTTLFSFRRNIGPIQNLFMHMQNLCMGLIHPALSDAISLAAEGHDGAGQFAGLNWTNAIVGLGMQPSAATDSEVCELLKSPGIVHLLACAQEAAKLPDGLLDYRRELMEQLRIEIGQSQFLHEQELRQPWAEGAIPGGQEGWRLAAVKLLAVTQLDCQVVFARRQLMMYSRRARWDPSFEFISGWDKRMDHPSIAGFSWHSPFLPPQSPPTSLCFSTPILPRHKILSFRNICLLPRHKTLSFRNILRPLLSRHTQSLVRDIRSSFLPLLSPLLPRHNKLYLPPPLAPLQPLSTDHFPS